MKQVHEYVEGDTDAAETLVPLVLDRLKRMAARPLTTRGRTPSAITVLSDIYQRLDNGKPVPGLGRAAFLFASGRAMRQFLVEKGRAPEADEGLKALVQALDRLEKLDERLLRVVEMRFLLGIGVEETAEALKAAAPTVVRDWLIARAWLQRELHAVRTGASSGEALPQSVHHDPARGNTADAVGG